MATVPRKLHAFSLVSLNLLWSVMVGLFLPRTPTFGIMVLAFLIPGLLCLTFWKFQSDATDKPSTPQQNSSNKEVPPWVYFGCTAGLTATHLLRAVFPESFLGFLVLTVVFGWPWFAISWRTCALYNRRLNQNPAFASAIGTSAGGLSVGFLIYAIQQTQVMSLFFSLLLGSVLCAIVAGITSQPIKTKPKDII